MRIQIDFSNINITMKVFPSIKDRLMYLLKYVFLTILLLSAGVLFGKDKSVVVLHSFNQGFLWTDHVNRGIQVFFRDKPVQISYEYMDSLRFSGERYIKALHDMLEVKYRDKMPDAVIVSGNSALDFIIRYNDLKTPVVFCGINNIPSGIRKGMTNITGIVDEISMKETLQFIFKTHSHAGTLHAFIDDSSGGRALLAELYETLSNLNSGIRVDVSIDKKAEDAAVNLKKVSREDVVLLMGIYPNSERTVLTEDALTSEVVSNSLAPVYSFWDFFLGKGIVGGKLINGYDQGFFSAEMAWKIVNGEDIRKVPSGNRAPNRFMFDYKMLERYHINRRFLPPGSVVINKPLPLYEQYKDIFLMAILLMVMFLWILIMYIFQQKKMKKTLQDRNVFLQNLIDSIPNLIFYKDLKGHYIGCNRAFEQFIGIARQEIIGMSASNIFDREEAETFDAAVRELVRTQKPMVSEEKVRRVDGFVRDMMSFRSLIFQSDRQPYGIVGVSIDITEQKLAEKELSRAKKETELTNLKLEANRDYLNKIINTISDPVFVKDADHRLVLINDAYCELMGLAREELLGKTNHALFAAEQADKFSESENFVLDSRFDNVEEDDFTNQKGEVRTHIVKKSLYIDNMQNKFIVGIISDITERKKLETELKLMNQDLGNRVWEEVNKNREKDLILIKQSRQAAMGEMIRNIAHQWRQPLNALGILIQNVQEHFRFGKLDEEYIDKTVKKSIELIQFMSRTIDDFKDFFKPDKEKAPFNVKETLFRAVSIVEASMKNSFIEMDLHLDRDIVANGYPNEYSQVVLNILSNAKDILLENRTKKPVVRIALEEEEGRSVLLIWNNGGEIPDEITHRIFEPYFTTKENGVGIGLYMSKMIIEKNMNGKLSFRNRDGGAEFRVVV